MFIIGTGIFRCIFEKLRIPWMILAICAGILCVDPAALTDLMGLAILALIIAVQVTQWKRERTILAI